MQFRRQVLPAPFGPMIARISLSLISMLISVRALTPPKESDRFSIFIRVAPALLFSTCFFFRQRHFLLNNSSRYPGTAGARVTLTGERPARRFAFLF